MTETERLLETAVAEIGYLEKHSNAFLDDKLANAGRNNFTKYARDLDKLWFYNGPKNGFEWCDVFVDWCFVQTFGMETALAMTGQQKGGLGAGCTFSARYYQEMGRFFTKDPQPGDQVFFTRDGGKTFCHTGLVERVEDGCVHTIEGNTSGASGVVSNGGGVCRKSYQLGSSYLGGYGRPNWSLATAVDAVATGNTMATGNSAEKRFNTIAEVRESAPWGEETIEKLVNRGYLEGKGKKDENGDPAELDLSQDMIRLLVVLDRAGAFDS